MTKKNEETLLEALRKIADDAGMGISSTDHKGANWLRAIKQTAEEAIHHVRTEGGDQII